MTAMSARSASELAHADLASACRHVRVPGTARTFEVRDQLRGLGLRWDPATQKEVWRVEQPGAWNGGVLSTAGGLVFEGNAAGSFSAYPLTFTYVGQAEAPQGKADVIEVPVALPEVLGTL